MPSERIIKMSLGGMKVVERFPAQECEDQEKERKSMIRGELSNADGGVFTFQKKMFCVLEKLKQKATSLSSLPFFSVCDLNSGGFHFSAFEIMSPFPFLLLCFLPAAACLCACMHASCTLGYITDAPIEIQRLVERLGGTHSLTDGPKKTKDLLVNPCKTCKKMNLIKC